MQCKSAGRASRCITKCYNRPHGPLAPSALASAQSKSLGPHSPIKPTTPPQLHPFPTAAPTPPQPSPVDITRSFHPGTAFVALRIRSHRGPPPILSPPSHPWGPLHSFFLNIFFFQKRTSQVAPGGVAPSISSQPLLPRNMDERRDIPHTRLRVTAPGDIPIDIPRHSGAR